MTKSQRALNWIRLVCLTLAPLMLIASFVFHFCFRFANNKNGIYVTFVLMLCACALLAIYFVLSIIFESLNKEKINEIINRETYISTNKFANFFKKLFVNIKFFTKKNEKTIRLVLNVLCSVIFTLTAVFCAFKLKYWNIYYSILVCYWALMIYFIFTFILSKNKKSFWINIGFITLSLIALLILTPKTHELFYGFATNTNTNIQDIMLGLITLLYFIPLRLLHAKGNINDYYHSGVVGYGCFSLLLSGVLYYVKTVAKILNENSVNANIIERLSELRVPLNIMFTIVIISIIVSIIYSINMYKYMFKSKKWFVIFDLIAVIIGLIIMILAIKNMSGYLIWYGR